MTDTLTEADDLHPPEHEPLGPAHSLGDTVDIGDLFQHNGLILPEGLSFDDWARVGPNLILMATGYRWWLGDWILYGETAFNEEAAQAIDPSWLNEEDIRQIPNYAWVARAFPPSERVLELSWTHHRIAAALGRKRDREKVLKMALEERLSTRKLQALVDDIKIQRDGDKSDGEIEISSRATTTHRVTIAVTGSKTDTDLIDEICRQAKEWISDQLLERGADEPTVSISER